MNTNQLTTSQFASEFLVKPQTILKRYCQTGSYFGIVPQAKLPNGRLVWPKPDTQECVKEEAAA